MAGFYRTASVLLMMFCVVCTAPGVEVEVEVATDPPAKALQMLNRRAEVEKVVTQMIEENHLKAVILAINHGEKRVLTLTAGESMAGVPATADMHVRLGSITIPYLGSLLLQLEQDGVLSLSDPVSQYLPELEKADEVTLKMLINCTSGYPDYVPYKKFADALYADVFRTWTPQELIDIAMEQPMPFEPGEGWSYAHTNFVILGLAMEKATGKSLDVLLEEKILKPFGLTATVDPGTPAIPDPVLHAYTRERDIYEDGTFWNPSWTLAKGAIMTGNLTDILTSARALGTGKQLTEESFQKMITPATTEIKPWNENRYYGLGIVVNYGWLMQNPSFQGFAGLMAYLPEQDISIAIYSSKLEEAEIDPNYSSKIFEKLTNVLTPKHAIK